MSRPRGAFVVSVVLLSLPVSLFGTASGSSLTPENAVAIRRLNPDSAHLRSYWTAERMRTATPVDVLQVSGERQLADARAAVVPGAHSSLGPGSVPPTAPEGTTVDLGSNRLQAHGGPAAAKTLATFTGGALNASQYQSHPYSTIGRIFFTDPSTGDNYACSGTALTSANQSVVWTAGHCVHGGGSDKSFYTNWIFVPSYKDRAAPSGTWPALQLLTPQQWSEDGNLHYDMAAVVVASRAGQRLTAVTGGRGIQWNLPSSQSFSAYGYPAAPPFDGERIFYCTSGLAGNGNPPGPGPLTLAIGCDMTQGSSGGGWIVQNAFINSDISYGVEGQPDVVYGPYFGDAAAALYQSASTSTLPGPLPGPTTSPTPVAPPTEAPGGPPVPASTPTPPSVPAPGGGGTSTPGGDTVAPSLTEVLDRPDPFTPNGDGVKDKVKFLFSLSEPSKVTLTIFKPSGLLLGELLPGGVQATQAARYLAKWNGKVGTKVVRRGTYKYVIAAVDDAGNRGAAEGTVTVRP